MRRPRPGRVEPADEKKEPHMIRMTRSTAQLLDRFKAENCYEGRGDAIRALLEMYYRGARVEPMCKKTRGILLG